MINNGISSDITQLKNLVIDYYKNNDIERAISTLRKFLNDKSDTISLFEQIFIHIILSILFFMKKNFNDALTEIQTVLSNSSCFQNEKLIVRLNHILALIHKKNGNLQLSIDCLNEALVNAENSDYFIEKILILQELGSIYHNYLGKFDNAIKCFKKALDTCKDTDEQEPIAELLNDIAWIYYLKGNIRLAKENYQNSINHAASTGDEKTIANSLASFGFLYMQSGEVDLALDYYGQYLEISKKLNNKPAIGWAFSNIGMALRHKGDLTLAKDYLESSLALHIQVKEENVQKKDQYSEEIGKCLPNWSEGNYLAVLDSYNSCLSQDFEEHNEELIARTLYDLITVTIEESDIQQAYQYYDQLLSIYDNSQSKFNKQVCILAEAVILKASRRARHRIAAEELLKTIVYGEIIQPKFTTDAMLHLCDLLLFELRVTGEEEVLNELNKLIRDLLEIASNRNSYWLLVECHLIKSKLCLLELEVTDAKDYLERAQFLAEEKGLVRLAKEISYQFDLLLFQLKKWENFIQKGASLDERLELTQLDDVVMRIAKYRLSSFPEQPSEEPVAVFILTRGGINLYARSFFIESSYKDDVSPHLMGGLISAINAFSDTLLEKERAEEVERITYKNHIIGMKRIDNLLFCYIFKGQSYSAVQKLRKFMTMIKNSLDIWENLQEGVEKGKMISEKALKNITSIVENIFL
jgi:tetratricopeptide (TPR) repeat protein